MQVLESGQELQAAWGDLPCHGDVWHILHQGEADGRNLAKKASRCHNEQRKARAFDGVSLH